MEWCTCKGKGTCTGCVIERNVCTNETQENWLLGFVKNAERLTKQNAELQRKLNPRSYRDEKTEQGLTGRFDRNLTDNEIKAISKAIYMIKGVSVVENSIQNSIAIIESQVDLKNESMEEGDQAENNRYIKRVGPPD